MSFLFIFLFLLNMPVYAKGKTAAGTTIVLEELLINRHSTYVTVHERLQYAARISGNRQVPVTVGYHSVVPRYGGAILAKGSNYVIMSGAHRVVGFNYRLPVQGAYVWYQNVFNQTLMFHFFAGRNFFPSARISKPFTLTTTTKLNGKNYTEFTATGLTPGTTLRWPWLSGNPDSWLAKLFSYGLIVLLLASLWLGYVFLQKTKMLKYYPQ